MLPRDEVAQACAVVGIVATDRHVAFTYDTISERDGFASRNITEHGHEVISARWQGQPCNLVTLHVPQPVELTP